MEMKKAELKLKREIESLNGPGEATNEMADVPLIFMIPEHKRSSGKPQQNILIKAREFIVKNNKV
jgi:hypothetical protein